ncbi:deoxyribonuclease I activity protein [Homalodisca vitripennis]|nr:deoxyribonuclease I activity protein [Homalodisca vitripennis]
MNCERLETLGDSFLKFAISLTLFENKPDWPEGHLTYVKSKIVGNKNLFYCGTKKRLGSLLEVHRFSPKEDWVPPGFCVEQSVQTVLRTAKLDPKDINDYEEEFWDDSDWEPFGEESDESENEFSSIKRSNKEKPLDNYLLQVAKKLLF